MLFIDDCYVVLYNNMTFHTMKLCDDVREFIILTDCDIAMTYSRKRTLSTQLLIFIEYHYMSQNFLEPFTERDWWVEIIVL